MSQQEFLTALIQWLEAERVPYYLTGSVASGMHGEPRTTHDIDIVVVMDGASVPHLATGFPPPRFYLDQPTARDAVRNHQVFNLIDSSTGVKADFWNPGAIPFEQSAMTRKVRIKTPYGEPWVASPEDTMLSKLRWAKMLGGSEQQMRDVQRVYEVSFKKLDQNYLDEWAKTLGVTELLILVRAQAKPLTD